MLKGSKNCAAFWVPGSDRDYCSLFIYILLFIGLPGWFAVTAAAGPPPGNLVHTQAYVSPQLWLSANKPDIRCDYVIPVNIVRIYSNEHSADSIAPKNWLYTQVEIANQLFRFSDRDMAQYGRGKPAPCMQFKIDKVYDVHEREVSEILGKELDTESLFGTPRDQNSQQKANTKDLRTLKVTDSTDYLTIYCVWSLRDPDEFINEFGGESNVGFADRPPTGPRRILTRVSSIPAIMGVVIARQEGTWMNTVAHELGHYFSLPHAWDSQNNRISGISDLGSGPQGQVDPDPRYANVMDYDNGSQVIHYFSKSQLAAMYSFLDKRATRYITANRTGGGSGGGQPPEIVARDAAAQIQNIWVDRPGETGNVTVHLKYNVNYMRSREGTAVAWFYDSSGRKLNDTDGQYRSTDGQVSVGAPFKPGYDNTVYDDFQLVVPAGQLHLLPGKHRIGVSAGLFNGSNMLASSQQTYFEYYIPGVPGEVAAGPPAAWITDVKVSPLVQYQGQPWVRISAWLTVDNLLGKNIRLQARFYFADGTPLRDFDGTYQSPEGLVMGENTCVPKYPRTNLSDWQVWVPYEQLHLVQGTYSLAARLTVVYESQALASRSSESFSVSPSVGKSTGDSGWVSGSAQVQHVWVTHNHGYGGDIGLQVHARLNITGCKDVSCTVVAWFYTADGRVLKDFDRYYTTYDGQVSTSTSVTPIYASANFSDVTLFIPYRQLHLLAGTHSLGVKVGVFRDSQSLAQQQDVTFFNVTW